MGDGYFCNSGQYALITGYLSRHIHGKPGKLDLTALWNDCESSIGFFGRVTKWHDNETLRVHADIWTAFPVTLGSGADQRTLYSYGGGSWLFSRQDIFPLKPCWLDDDEFRCPARSRLWLSRDYKDIRMPWNFNPK